MTKGVVASGHPLTSQAAAEILRAGGNAFDACVAAALTATVAEPLLASLGGGGFLLAMDATGSARLYDFFAQTPGNKKSDCSYQKIVADFGDVTQDFYIGMSSVAVPGVPAGLDLIQQQLSSLPMSDLMSPALETAQAPVEMNRQQAGVAQILKDIIASTPSLKKQFSHSDGRWLCSGDIQDMSASVSSLEMLARYGSKPFYNGEIADEICKLSRAEGGHLTWDDLIGYQVAVREPLQYKFRGARIWSNPPPSGGGVLIANTMCAYQASQSQTHLDGISSALKQTDLLKQFGFSEQSDDSLPDDIRDQCMQVMSETVVSRGTTHISVIDDQHNLASMTLSNGEGSACVVADGGLHLNNFLGEEDLMPAGIGSWRENCRLSSMMSPSIMSANKNLYVIGSAGSNRIRSAIAQVMINVHSRDLNLQDAVDAPRMHIDVGHMDVEPDFAEQHAMQGLLDRFDGTSRQWQHRSLFFGGVNASMVSGSGQFSGCSDSRRGGSVIIVD